MHHCGLAELTRWHPKAVTRQVNTFLFHSAAQSKVQHWSGHRLVSKAPVARRVEPLRKRSGDTKERCPVRQALGGRNAMWLSIRPNVLSSIPHASRLFRTFKYGLLPTRIQAQHARSVLVLPSKSSHQRQQISKSANVQWSHCTNHRSVSLEQISTLACLILI